MEMCIYSPQTENKSAKIFVMDKANRLQVGIESPLRWHLPLLPGVECHPEPTVEPLENESMLFPTSNGCISQSEGKGN